MQDMSGRHATGIGIANTAILGCLFEQLIRDKVLTEASVATILRNALTATGSNTTQPAVQAREIIGEFNTRVTKAFKKDADKN
jgi:hypothetical protein